MDVISVFAHEFERHRSLLERAMECLSDDQFFVCPGERVNPVAVIVKHLAGNLQSRWSDFLTTDGEKPTRNRDREFVLDDDDTRARLMESWRLAWITLAGTLRELSDDDLGRHVTIRGEPHTVLQALLRSVNHVAYHAGQVLHLARLFRPDAEWLTIPPGMSSKHRAGYLRERPP